MILYSDILTAVIPEISDYFGISSRPFPTLIGKFLSTPKFGSSFCDWINANTPPVASKTGNSRNYQSAKHRRTTET